MIQNESAIKCNWKKIVFGKQIGNWFMPDKYNFL